MRVAAVIVILWCLFSVCSCGGGSKMDARFQEIDRLTDSLPLEAIRRLDSVNTAGLSEKELYRYRLLWIKSRDKAYITHRSDTLILDVIDYYNINALKDRNVRSLIDSRILESQVYQELKDMIDSNECIGKSDDILRRLSELIETVTPGFGNRLDILTEWTISDRERNVALLMRCGFSNSQIATLLAKSKSTISSQRNAIAKKAGLTVNGINAAIASL